MNHTEKARRRLRACESVRRARQHLVAALKFLEPLRVENEAAILRIGGAIDDLDETIEGDLVEVVENAVTRDEKKAGA